MDLVKKADEITATYDEGETTTVKLHDGTPLVLKKQSSEYDPTDPIKAHAYIREHQLKGQVPTGLLFINREKDDMHGYAQSSQTPLVDLPYEKLCPGSEALEALVNDLR